MRPCVPRLTPPFDFPRIDMARDDALHQNVSTAHAIAHLSVGPHPRVAVDGFSTFAITDAVPTHRAAACAPSAIPTREATAPARTRRRFLPWCGPHRGWADRHVDTVA